MIRKKFCRRPELESLEAMVLLSGTSVVRHSGVAALVAPVAKTAGPIVLSGSARGTFQAEGGAGAPTSFSGKGHISPLGNATLKGSLQLAIANPTGSVTLTVKKHGQLFASLSTKGLGSPVFYTITGGTGTFAGDSGSGEAILTTKGSSHGRVTITFENLTT
jgi:hypothetical protein